MSFISNVHKGNTVKEHVGFVVLRASLAARKPNCELIMGLVTRSPKEAEVRVRRGVALCRPYIRSQIVGFCGKETWQFTFVRQCDAKYANRLY